MSMDALCKNIRRLEYEGMVGKYGFYESIDYTIPRVGKSGKAIVKTYMAHHQGLILCAINNYISNQVLIKRFSENPEIEAVDILLQEEKQNRITKPAYDSRCSFQPDEKKGLSSNLYYRDL